MNVSKISWYLRTILKRPLYGNIGKHTYMGKALFIQRKKNIYLGNNVRIYPGMRAELVEPSAKIIISDNVSIGQNFHVVSYKNSLEIGRNCTISANVFISNVDHDYRKLDKHILEQEMIEKNTAIGENCFIGYGAVIMPGTVLGKQCIVGANSVVKGEYPDYCVIAGIPARIVKIYNVETKMWVKV